MFYKNYVILQHAFRLQEERILLIKMKSPLPSCNNSSTSSVLMQVKLTRKKCKNISLAASKTNVNVYIFAVMIFIYLFLLASLYIHRIVFFAKRKCILVLDVTVLKEVFKDQYMNNFMWFFKKFCSNGGVKKQCMFDREATTPSISRQWHWQ